jgi:hypothetical protein
MPVPGRSIRPGNFHRGRQECFWHAKLAWLFGGGPGGVFKEGFAVLFGTFSVISSSEILVDVLLRLILGS